MAVTTRCQHCGQRYSVREDLLGKQIKCKACGQAMTIAAEPAAPKAAASKPGSSAAAPRPAARPASGAVKPPAGAAAESAKRAAAVASLARPAAAGAAKPAPRKAAPAADPLGASAPADDPLFGPSTNFLDLLNDASLPAAGAAPLGSGVVLKASKPAAVAAKPAAAAKKKKKKKGAGGLTIQTKTTLRMRWGAFIVLLGLGAFGAAVAVVVTGFSFRLVRFLIVVGFLLIGGGLKLIVG